MSVRILEGDCRDVLATLPDASVHCCVTSPPYFGLRDYGVDGQMGLEDSPEAFVEGMVAVFRDVRRVLRDDGTLWLNIGDSYGDGKQLLLVPSRLAIALQGDGWLLRSHIVWAKTCCMPEPVKDRPTRSWESVFLFAKQEDYFYDFEAAKEPAEYFGRSTNAEKGSFKGKHGDKAFRHVSEFRNPRNVWHLPPDVRFGAEHFAVMPPALAEKCIAVGCPVDGMVLDPFGGAGTTALVADRLQRNAILIELNPAYAEMARRRIDNDRGALLDAMEAAA